MKISQTKLIVLGVLFGMLGSMAASATPLYIPTPTKVWKHKEPVQCNASQHVTPYGFGAYAVKSGYAKMTTDKNPIEEIKCAPDELVLSKNLSYYGPDTNNKKIPLLGPYTIFGGGDDQCYKSPYNNCSKSSPLYHYYATYDVGVSQGDDAWTVFKKCFTACTTVCSEGGFVELELVCGTIQAISLEPQEWRGVQPAEPVQPQGDANPSWFRR